jgi:hypothetical protein
LANPSDEDPSLSLERIDLTLATSPKEPTIRSGTQQTAKRAIEVLVSKGVGFHQPTKRERDALLIAFATCGKAIHGAAFDVVRLSGYVDLTDPDAICANIDKLELFEVKSTNRAVIEPDFGGYFFNLTTAELLVAQALGERFRFAFVNTITRDHIELTLQEVFSRARGIYPTWSIKF